MAYAPVARGRWLPRPLKLSYNHTTKLHRVGRIYNGRPGVLVEVGGGMRSDDGRPGVLVEVGGGSGDGRPGVLVEVGGGSDGGRPRALVEQGVSLRLRFRQRVFLPRTFS